MVLRPVRWLRDMFAQDKARPDDWLVTMGMAPGAYDLSPLWAGFAEQSVWLQATFWAMFLDSRTGAWRLHGSILRNPVSHRAAHWPTICRITLNCSALPPRLGVFRWPHLLPQARSLLIWGGAPFGRQAWSFGMETGRAWSLISCARGLLPWQFHHGPQSNGRRCETRWCCGGLSLANAVGGLCLYVIFLLG